MGIPRRHAPLEKDDNADGYYGYGSYAAYSDAVNGSGGTGGGAILSDTPDTTLMGTPPTPPGGDSVLTIRGTGANDPKLTDAQRIRRKTRDLGKPEDVAPPDAADLSVRAQGLGRVRRVRKGSRRDSFLGDTQWSTPPVGSSSLLGDL